jgi:uncharacterized cupredoxin-like copper-binding protein
MIAIAVMALAVAACTPEVMPETGPSFVSETMMAVGRVVEVNVYEFGIDYKSAPFEAGETITFVVTNTGVAPHEFEVTGAEAIEGHLEGGHDEHDMVMSEKLVLGVGETDELTVTIGPDSNIAACLIPGHYEAGMWINLDG